jgi:hypothetical protein
VREVFFGMEEFRLPKLLCLKEKELPSTAARSLLFLNWTLGSPSQKPQVFFWSGMSITVKIIETETGRRRFAFGYVMYADVFLIPLSNINIQHAHAHAHAHDTTARCAYTARTVHYALCVMREIGLGSCLWFWFWFIFMIIKQVNNKPKLKLGFAMLMFITQFTWLSTNQAGGQCL